MIREMARPTIPRRLMTFVAIVELLSVNVPRVQASEQSELQPVTATSTAKTAVADLRAARVLVAELLKSSDPAKVALGKRMSPWVDVASATTRAQRHAAIQKLPVKVLFAAPEDGRAGILKTFVAGGKVRASRFIPASPLPTVPNTSVEPGGKGLGGPDVPVEMDGRWKSDGNGGCYWDASDSGPDQCTPPTPASTCYFDGAPADCATQQDLDDALALAASATNEVEQAQAGADAEMAEIEEYCSENPWNCSDNGQRVGGPSCGIPCVGELGRFAGAAIGTNGAIITLAVVAMAPAAPVLAVAGATVAVTAGLFAMFGTASSLLDCKRASIGRI